MATEYGPVSEAFKLRHPFVVGIPGTTDHVRFTTLNCAARSVVLNKWRVVVYDERDKVAMPWEEVIRYAGRVNA